MNKFILEDFLTEFYKNYDQRTFSGLEIINNYSLDQSSVFIKQGKNDDLQSRPIYSISPMNVTCVKDILTAASDKLPTDGYFVREKSNNFADNYVTFDEEKVE